MGEGFREAMAGAFTLRSNRAHSKRLATASLFSSQPLFLAHKFKCRAHLGASPINKTAKVEIVQIGNVLKVVSGHAELGVVCEEDTSEILTAFQSEPLAAGFIQAEIADEVGLDGCFRVMPEAPPDERPKESK